MVLKPRASDVPIAIEIPSNEGDDISRGPPGLLETSAPAPTFPSSVIFILIHYPGAKNSFYEAKELLHIGFKEL